MAYKAPYPELTLTLREIYMKLLYFRRTAFALALSMSGAQPTLALPFNFSGAFTQDDDYQFFTFTMAASDTVSLATTSYGGAGAFDGFVPYLHVWDSTGVDLGGYEATNSNAIYAIGLTAGLYYIGLTVANNIATGDFPGGSSTPTPDVFNQNGTGNFTYVNFSCAGFGPDGPFYGQDCASHTGYWALSVSGDAVSGASLWPAAAAAVPEPASLALALAGAAAFAPYARRRRSSASA
jgi:hypothetical protein